MVKPRERQKGERESIGEKRRSKQQELMLRTLSERNPSPMRTGDLEIKNTAVRTKSNDLRTGEYFKICKSSAECR